MGKTGGHKKKSSKTGTQKKTLKLSAKEHRAAKTTREAARKEQEYLMSPEAHKFLEQFTTGEGQKKSIMNAQELLRPILEGQRNEALQQFDRDTLPQLQGAYGRGNRGSSAFNQALSASRMDLANQLFNKNAELSLNYGSQLAQNQQQAGQQLFQNRQNAANFGSQAGLSQGNLNATTDQSIYMPKSTPVALQLAQAGIKQGVKSGVAAATGGASAVGEAAADLGSTNQL